jgi:hypothetical protein
MQPDILTLLKKLSVQFLKDSNCIMSYIHEMLHNYISDTGVYFSSDVVTKDEAIAMLKEMLSGKEEREEQMKRVGYPAYTTQAGNRNITVKLL